MRRPLLVALLLCLPLSAARAADPPPAEWLEIQATDTRWAMRTPAHQRVMSAIAADQPPPSAGPTIITLHEGTALGLDPGGTVHRAPLAGLLAGRPAWQAAYPFSAMAGGPDSGSRTLTSIVCKRDGRGSCIGLLTLPGQDVADAVEINLASGQRVIGGFAATVEVPVDGSLSNLGWSGPDSVLFAPVAGLGQVGEPASLKRWTRAKGTEVLSTFDDPMTVVRIFSPPAEGGPTLLYAVDAQGQRGSLIRGSRSEPFQVEPPGEVQFLFQGGVVVKSMVGMPAQPWTGDVAVEPGDLVWTPLPGTPGKAVVLLRSGVDGAVGEVVPRSGFVAATTFRDGGMRLRHVTLDKGRAKVDTVALPTDGTVTLLGDDAVTGLSLVGHESYLQGPALYLVSPDGKATHVGGYPPQGTTGLKVTWKSARADDGTEIPFALVGRDPERPGPTCLTAYGGFGLVNSPRYLAVEKAGWLSRGGTLAVALPRGGGEFGPGWAAAGSGPSLGRSVGDLLAVARALRDQGTGPLCAYGDSHGGWLATMAALREPGLFKAVATDSAPYDLERLLSDAPSTWLASYRFEGVEAMRAAAPALSPVTLLKPGTPYPRFLVGAAADDPRVPVDQSRRFAWALKQAGADVLYAERKEGGHASPGTGEHALRWSWLAKAMGLP